MQLELLHIVGRRENWLINWFSSLTEGISWSKNYTAIKQIFKTYCSAVSNKTNHTRTLTQKFQLEVSTQQRYRHILTKKQEKNVIY